jgi:hypothetical protein
VDVLIDAVHVKILQRKGRRCDSEDKNRPPGLGQHVVRVVEGNRQRVVTGFYSGADARFTNRRLVVLRGGDTGERRVGSCSYVYVYIKRINEGTNVK